MHYFVKQILINYKEDDIHWTKQLGWRKELSGQLGHCGTFEGCEPLKIHPLESLVAAWGNLQISGFKILKRMEISFNQDMMDFHFSVPCETSPQTSEKV